MDKLKALKEILTRYFEIKESDMDNSYSSNSVLADINIEKGTTGFYQKHWMKRHKETRAVNKNPTHMGGSSRIENTPYLREINSIYRKLDPSHQNLLFHHLFFDLSYSNLAKEFRQLHLTEYQIRAIFRRKIYPYFLDNLGHVD